MAVNSKERFKSGQRSEATMKEADVRDSIEVEKVSCKTTSKK